MAKIAPTPVTTERVLDTLRDAGIVTSNDVQTEAVGVDLDGDGVASEAEKFGDVTGDDKIDGLDVATYVAREGDHVLLDTLERALKQDGTLHGAFATPQVESLRASIAARRATVPVDKGMSRVVKTTALLDGLNIVSDADKPVQVARRKALAERLIAWGYWPAAGPGAVFLADGRKVAGQVRIWDGKRELTFDKPCAVAMPDGTHPLASKVIYDRQGKLLRADFEPTRLMTVGSRENGATASSFLTLVAAGMTEGLLPEGVTVDASFVRHDESGVMAVGVKNDEPTRAKLSKPVDQPIELKTGALLLRDNKVVGFEHASPPVMLEVPGFEEKLPVVTAAPMQGGGFAYRLGMTVAVDDRFLAASDIIMLDANGRRCGVAKSSETTSGDHRQDAPWERSSWAVGVRYNDDDTVAVACLPSPTKIAVKLPGEATAADLQLLTLATYPSGNIHHVRAGYPQGGGKLETELNANVAFDVTLPGNRVVRALEAWWDEQGNLLRVCTLDNQTRLVADRPEVSGRDITYRAGRVVVVTDHQETRGEAVFLPLDSTQPRVRGWELHSDTGAVLATRTTLLDGLDEAKKLANIKSAHTRGLSFGDCRLQLDSAASTTRISFDKLSSIEVILKDGTLVTRVEWIAVSTCSDPRVASEIVTVEPVEVKVGGAYISGRHILVDPAGNVTGVRP